MQGTTYTRPAVLFHWVIAALILLNLPLGLITPQLDYGITRLVLLRVHAGIGLLVLVLSLGRGAWRLRHQPPALPENTSSLVRRASHAAHTALYVLMFSLPLSGIAMVLAAGTYRVLLGRPMTISPDFEAAALPAAVHVVGAFILMGLLALHVGAVLLHQLVWRDGLLTRMTWETRRPSAASEHLAITANAPQA